MILILFAALGLLFGSFVNAFVWRLHEQETLGAKKKRPSKQELAELSIMKGRSMCPDCKHELAAKDLVPILSWLYLKGRCRYCRRPISWQYPAVELITAGLFTLSFLAWPQDLDSGLQVLLLGIWLVFIVMFMALAVYDLRWFLLPDRVVFPLMLLALIYVVLCAVDQSNVHVVTDALLGGLVIAGTFWLLFQVSAGKWIGGGDVKLAVVLGLLAGTPLKALLILFFSSIIGSICSIPILLKGKKAMQMQVPFGPFLLAATVIVVLYGTQVIDWYSQRLLGQ